MTDDDLFDLFPLDAADALDFTVPLDATLQELALPPIAGGAPGILDDAWDWIVDIVTGAGDIIEKIGKLINDLWDWIWGHIGGAVRFVWDWLVTAFDWLSSAVSSLLHQMWSWLYDPAQGLWQGIWHRVGTVWDWIRDGIADAKAFVGWVSDYVWEHKWDPVAGAFHGIAGGLHWVESRVGEWSEWLWNTLTTAVNDARNFINDGITYLYDHGITPIMGAVDQVGAAFRELLETIGDKIRDAITWPLEHIFEPFVDVLEFKLSIPGKLVRGEYSDLRQLVDDAMDPAPVILAGAAGLFILIMVISAAFQTTWQTFVTPMALPHVQATASRVGAELLSRGDLQEARWRQLPVDVDGQLSRYGYNDAARSAIAELDKRIPGPGDLVRFAVREAFDRSQAESLGFVTPLPGDFSLWLQRQGYDQEWAERFWWSHWDLPSIGQGMEMFHRLRGQFGEQDLRGLLRALDVPPVWHDRFIQIAYRPFTRVDVRRMFVLGILDENGVRDAYLDLGYSPERAQAMTEFTKRYAAPDEDGELKEMRDLAQTSIRQGYRRHVIEREQALDYLVLAGYSEDVAEFLLTIDDVQLGIRPDLDADVDVRELTSSVIRSAYRERIWDRTKAQTELEALGYLPGSADLMLSLDDLATERELTGLEISVVRESYRANAIDRLEAGRQLDAAGVSAERRDLLIRRWDLDKAQKPRTLSVSQLQRAFRQGLITDVELLDGILVEGYNQRDAELLVDMIDEEPARRERRLSVSQLQRAFQAGELTDVELLQAFIGLDYSQADAELLVNLTDPDPDRQLRRLSVSQLAKSFQAGLLTEPELLDEYLALGYSQRDAEFLVVLARQE